MSFPKIGNTGKERGWRWVLFGTCSILDVSRKLRSAQETVGMRLCGAAPGLERGFRRLWHMRGNYSPGNAGAPKDRRWTQKRNNPKQNLTSISILRQVGEGSTEGHWEALRDQGGVCHHRSADRGVKEGVVSGPSAPRGQAESWGGSIASSKGCYW